MANFHQAKEGYGVYSDIARNVFNQMARSAGMLCCQVAIVGSVSQTGARVYFPTDMTVLSAEYPNISGKTLNVGQKVYVFYKYGDVEQGWIAV